MCSGLQLENVVERITRTRKSCFSLTDTQLPSLGYRLNPDLMTTNLPRAPILRVLSLKILLSAVSYLCVKRCVTVVINFGAYRASPSYRTVRVGSYACNFITSVAIRCQPMRHTKAVLDGKGQLQSVPRFHSPSAAIRLI